jgi:hypothetical protein
LRENGVACVSAVLQKSSAVAHITHAPMIKTGEIRKRIKQNPTFCVLTLYLKVLL